MARTLNPAVHTVRRDGRQVADMLLLLTAGALALALGSVRFVRKDIAV
jgi:hypothetical protein